MPELPLLEDWWSGTWRVSLALTQWNVPNIIAKSQRKSTVETAAQSPPMQLAKIEGERSVTTLWGTRHIITARDPDPIPLFWNRGSVKPVEILELRVAVAADLGESFS